MFDFFAAVVIFGLFVLALSLGLIFGHRPLKGSCGGLNNLKKLLGMTPCEGCTESGPECPLREMRDFQNRKTKDEV